MTRRIDRWIAAVSVAAALAAGVAIGQEAGEWQPLFNGKDLSNFVQRNGWAHFSIDGDAILGRTSEGSPNSFLCTRKDYGDFELEFEVKVDDALNSGVQIRSRSIPQRDNGRVHGPQVEIAVNGSAGYIYGEATGRGWISAEQPNRDQFKRGDWNKYRVLARGTKVQVWVNEVLTGDIDDAESYTSGFIGLQVHNVGAGEGPYEVRWRNLRIRELQ